MSRLSRWWLGWVDAETRLDALRQMLDAQNTRMVRTCKAYEDTIEVLKKIIHKQQHKED